MHASLLGWGALALGGISAILVLGFLVRAPQLTASLKLLLLFGLFVLPSGTAVLGNVANLEASKSVQFCGSCHVMDSYVSDLQNPDSRSLASLHGQLPAFADDACYGCHADYGMYGGVTTKIGGMHHVYSFYSDDWTTPGHRPPELYEPYDTRVCLSCHNPVRKGAPLEHRVHGDKITSREIKCTNAGCHGRPHPAWEQTK